MSEAYTIARVTGDLEFILTLTNVFKTDDEGYWCFVDNNERFTDTFDSGDVQRPVVVFQDPLPKGDYVLFNPFSEGLGKQNPATKIYFKTIRVALNQTIMQIMLHVAQAVLDAKVAAKDKDTDTMTISHAAVRMSSIPLSAKRQTIYDVIDEDMITEFMTLFTRNDDTLLHVPYYRNHQKAKVTCAPLESADWDTQFGKGIRKRTLAAFKALLMGILGITQPSDLRQFEFKYDPSLKSAPQLHSILSVYLQLYSKFNDIIAEAYTKDGKSGEHFEINLGELSDVIERFPAAYAIAKHRIQPTLPPVEATSTSTADTSSLRFSTQANPGQGRRFAPQVLDSFGNPVQQAGGAPTMAPPNGGSNRFQPMVVNTAVDPTLPLTRPMMAQPGPMMAPMQPGFGQPMMQPGWGAPSFAPMGMSPAFPQFNNTVPMNFNTPGTRSNFPRF